MSNVIFILRLAGALLLVAAAAVVVAVAGCAPFDRADQITDLRILAVELDVPEVLYTPVSAGVSLGAGGGAGGPGGPPGSAPAGDDDEPPGGAFPVAADIVVNVNMLAFDPRGGAINGSVGFCPEDESDAVCAAFDPKSVIDAAPAEQRAKVERVFTPRVLSSDDVSVAADDPAGAVVGLTFEYAFPPAAVGAALEDTQLSLFSALPRFFVDLESPTHAEVVHERAFKRLPLTLDVTSADVPAALRQPLLAQLDVDVCSEEQAAAAASVPGLAECFVPRVANRNPALVGFAVDVDAPADGIDLSGEPPLPAQASVEMSASEIVVEPVFGADSVESYQGFRLDVDAGVTRLENRTEELVATWYATNGDVSAGQTRASDGRMGITWTIEAPTERDVLIVVVLDGRGGTAVGRVDVTHTN